MKIKKRSIHHESSSVWGLDLVKGQLKLIWVPQTSQIPLHLRDYTRAHKLHLLPDIK